MWGALLGSPLARAGIALALVLGVIGIQTLRLDHAKHELADLKASDAKALARAKAETSAREAQAAVISAKASQDIQAAHVAVTQRLAPLVKRIYVDVPPDVDADCRIVPGFVSLWNAGVEVSDPGLSGATNGPAKPAAGARHTP